MTSCSFNHGKRNIRMNENLPAVDIVIPVYNAFEDLVLCVRSILKHTDLTRTDLLLIDDASTDKRIAPYLTELAAQGKPGIKILRNDHNIGFVATVNRGVAHSNRDVVLLNSDTIVTAGWLEGLAAAAYKDSSIGTVTPMSNNASHCSVYLEQRNLSIDRLGERLRAVSLHEYTDIGVGVGFCLYIKRLVWNEVGKLDVESYRTGYGEEVDFCLRCEQLGYRHILCDNVFVYHKGTTSFSEADKLRNLKISDRILHKKYGKQMENMLRIADRVRLGDWRVNAELYGSMENGHKNLLYLLQSDFREDAANNIGGTQFHVKDLVLNLRKKYNVFVAARDGDYLRFTAYIGQQHFSFKFYIKSPQLFPVYRLQSMRELWDDLLSAFEIDLVHIHHTYSLTLDLYYAAKDRGLPLIATLHDFYTICPTIKLLENDEQLCIGRENPETCRKCLQNLYQVAPATDLISKWRTEHIKALMLCDTIVVPSYDTKRIFELYYTQLLGRIVVIPHGYDKPCRKTNLYDRFETRNTVHFNIQSEPEMLARGHIIGWCYLEDCESIESHLFIALECGQTRMLVPIMSYDYADLCVIDPRYRYSGFNVQLPITNLRAGTWTIRMAVQNGDNCVISEMSKTLTLKEAIEDKRLHIAFIGGLNQAKGSQIAYSMIKHETKNVDWFIFGGIGDRELTYLEQDNLFKTNWYHRENICDLFELYQIDLVCIPSIWPETFCYTLSEAVLSGRPVLTTDIGALGERVRDMDCGWVVPLENCAKNMLAKVEEIRNNPTLLAEKEARIKRLCHKTNAEMAAEYDLLYERFANPNNKGKPFNTRRIYEGYLLGEKLRSKGQNGEPIGSHLQSRVNELEQELEGIRISTTYKIALAMRSLKIPFKRQIKLGMFKVYKFLKSKRTV